MNGLLNRLYGFDGLGFGADGVEFGWTVPIPAWAWLLVLAGACCISGLIYARAAMRPGIRAVAGLCRTGLLVALAALALGPRLERPRSRVEADRVIYLVDRSASMSVEDRTGRSRAQQFGQLTADHTDVFAAIRESKDARWYAFGSRVDELNAGDEVIPAMPASLDSSTRIGDAISGVLRANIGHPISGVVVFSDGRSGNPASKETLAQLRSASIPIIAVPLGSSSQEADLAITSASAPSIAFVDDTVPVRVRLAAGSGEGTLGGVLEIVEAETGVLLESAAVTQASIDAGEITVPVRMDREGTQNWTVRYVPDGADLSEANNETQLSVRFIDTPIRVLYIDGSPRWEWRYLKTALIREDSVDASCLLLAADRRFQQEGNTVLDTLPTSDEEWDEFDLIIIGDLNAALLGERAISAIRTQVGERGTGLLWLAGPSATPGSWAGSPLADLLPIRPGADAQRTAVWTTPVVFSSTPAADQLGMFSDLQTANGVGDASVGWSSLRWALRIEPSQIKPAVEPFALATPTATDEPGSPLVLAMRYGGGRTSLIATDEIWRWRYGRGEVLTERFWLPIIRHLARPRLAALGASSSLSVSSQLVLAGQPVSVDLVITDRALADISPRTFRAIAKRAADRSGGGRAEAIEFELTRESTEGPGVTRYRGTFTPLRAGSFDVMLADGDLLAATPARIDVMPEHDELRTPQADHAFLRSLAEETGGAMIAPEEIATLAESLPNRRVIVPLPPETRELWDHPVPLALLVLLGATEWIVRRKSRLP